MSASDLFVTSVKARLTRKGMSVRSAALALGLPVRSLYGILSDGQVPTLNRAAEICDALGIEFYIGPPRYGAVRDTDSPDAYNVLAGPKAEKIEALRIQIADLAEQLNMTALEALAETGPDDSAPPGARPVSVVEIAPAAGGGTVVEDELVTGRVWFRQDWLDIQGLDPRQCVVMGVRGESMEPTLMDGASILVNRERTDKRNNHIYVIRTGDGLVAKRLTKNKNQPWMLFSDNNAIKPIPWKNDMAVIGEIRWTARSLPA